MKTALSILSYNLYFGRALNELTQIVQTHRPDIVCVQEFPVSESSVGQIEKLGYELADYSQSFFKFFRLFSVATFYNPKRLKHHNGVSINLTQGFYELILLLLRLGGTERTALSNHFSLHGSRQQVRVCNLHLTALQSTNKVRMKQLNTALGFLSAEPRTPTVVIGDFNYMYRRKHLETIFHRYHYREATNNLLYTLEWVILKFWRIRNKPDYVWYKGLRKVKTTRIERKNSDHFPILAQFKV